MRVLIRDTEHRQRELLYLYSTLLAGYGATPVLGSIENHAVPDRGPAPPVRFAKVQLRSGNRHGGIDPRPTDIPRIQVQTLPNRPRTTL